MSTQAQQRFTPRLFKSLSIGLVLAGIWVTLIIYKVEPFLGATQDVDKMQFLLPTVPMAVMALILWFTSKLLDNFFNKNIGRVIKDWVFVLLIVGFAALPMAVYISTVIDSTWETRNHLYGFGFLLFSYTIIASALFLLPFGFTYALEYIRETPWYRDKRLFGTLSARFGSIYSFRRHAMKINDKDNAQGKASQIYLGRTLFADDPKRRAIGVAPDSHMITIGMTGSGKAATSAWHNLAMYQGSMIVFDPKGEHARMTFKRRQNWRSHPDAAWRHDLKTSIKEPSHCAMLDPFGVNEKTDIPASSYNPLSDIPLNDETKAGGLIRCIADGCVIAEDGKNSHFSDHARRFIFALIGHVLTTYPRENHTLPFVYDLFYGVNDETGAVEENGFNNLLLDMTQNGAYGNQINAPARDLLEMGDNELGSVMSTISRSLGWIAEPVMRKQLSHSNISLKNFGHQETERFHWRRWFFKQEKVSLGKCQVKQTLYVVMPFERMQKEPRWMRVLSSMSVEMLCTIGKRPEIPTVILLDEFKQLGGRVTSIVNAFNIARSSGVKIWIMLQHLEQIQKQYPDEWNDMISGSTMQVFGVNDKTTAEYVSRRAGQVIEVQTERRGIFRRKRIVRQDKMDLLNETNVYTFLGKGKNHQIVFTPSGDVFRLERVGFQTFTTFDGDTFHGIETTTKVSDLYSFG